MHSKTVNKIAHDHHFGESDGKNEKRTLMVVLLTASTMIVEITAGYLTGSMALLADGWHMGTHAFALGISYAAYLLARKHMESSRFSFGTGKFGILGGYTSALFLGTTALWMIYESIHRLFNPVSIAFDEAILVTIVGLTVNGASVFILHNSGEHGHDHGHSHHHHDHDHDHGHDHSHQDQNYKAAYLHVIADTLTSVFALAALLAGRYLGWSFLDPVMGIVGGLLISRWAYGLLKDTGLILLDGEIDPEIRKQAVELIESDGESRIADLHVWRLGSKEVSILATVVTGEGRQPEEYQARLADLPNAAHVNVEVRACQDHECRCHCHDAQHSGG
ncbi:cation diffusion facilitator family transporter [Desulfatibacillum alkenivorans DSM 16219]|uniref:Cation diffusion facilitator family transporter n=1 Tax=Desulfatibacillum alkenivorans DSM 16219 TaxID=1121393 RepID=A0A1M6LBB2_9BACT|nr:CDF family Co(II)/Ni(II) efflux transporter DmeF [Desulfatibacillum alkenivorans]SHJ68510.1 cation diffusion facilitator family transporter [Desulfatibacillum alkenivorans DSM 16219]